MSFPPVTPFLDCHSGPKDAVLLTRFYVPVQAEFSRQVLESRGIPVWMGGENTFAVHSWYTAAGFYVRPGDAEEALRILRDLWGEGQDADRLIEDMPDDGGVDMPAEAEPSEPCPHCGGVRVRDLEPAVRPTWRRILGAVELLFSLAFMLVLPAPRHHPARHCPDCGWEW